VPPTTTDHDWPASTNLVYPTGHGAVISLKMQVKPVQDLLHAAIEQVIGDIWFENAYPESSTRLSDTRTILRSCAKKLGFADIRERLKCDDKYANDLAAIVCCLFSIKIKFYFSYPLVSPMHVSAMSDRTLSDVVPIRSLDTTD
jgi:hypothetical protein